MKYSKMQEITYSFIIPHHNCPKLLNRCLNSIPKRNDIQIIVVDDNSDVDKKPIEDGRPGVEYIYINKEETKGAGRARNRGLAKAKGKWLLFADSDDYYKEGFLDVLGKYVGSTYDIIYFNFEFRDGNTLEPLPDLHFKKYFDLYDGSSALKDEIRFHHNVPWTKMISKEYVTKYGLFFEEVPNGNDIFFSMMAGFFTKNITVEKDCIYVYLRNENSILTCKNQSVDSYMCKFIHRIKQNQFYKYIGYPEWKFPICKIFISIIKQSGILFLIECCLCCFSLYKKRNEWVNIVKNNKKLQIMTIDSIRIRVRELFNPYLGKWRQIIDNINSNFTIISNNCWAGHVYRYYNLPYNTPTVGLFFFSEDYIKFIYNLRYYVSLDIKFISVNDSKYKDVLSKRGHVNVPIGILDDIEIIFLHYKDETEAYNKWMRRKKRINFDNIYYKMSEMNLCSVEHLKKFDEFKVNKKILFVTKDYGLKSQLIFKDYINQTEISNDTTNFKKYISLRNFLHA